ncbi:MAG: UDP-glucose/GDP-mannose dehydrogenase family protein [Syntrophobacteraceae bacterium]
MRVSIFGLGYVGAVTAGCLADAGHIVTAVDTNRTKVDLINGSRSPIIEKDIERILAANVQGKRLRATTDHAGAVRDSDVSLICVGTPSQPNGDLDLRYVRGVVEQIGHEIGRKDDYHLVVVRSTILPGTMRKTIIPVLREKSGKTPGTDFGVCMNPEFLREGSAVSDFYNPPKTVIGQLDERSGNVAEMLYESLHVPVFRTALEVAEMVKYTDNAWHALKIGFANEIGNICKELKIDSHQVMDIFCRDTKLNLSRCYLRPGFAFGGSCLPKDVRALNYKAKMLDLEIPILSSILKSNAGQIERGLGMIMQNGCKSIGILGFSFKEGTDDLRESPVVELIERLIGKGYFLKIYDPNVNIARLMGANRDYILNHIPHISNLMVDTLREAVEGSEVVVIGTNYPEFSKLRDSIRGKQLVIDFVRVGNLPEQDENYCGICW